MKIKHLIIVSLILAILTIGAVSAADDADALADGADDSLSVDDNDIISDEEYDDGEDEDPDVMVSVDDNGGYPISEDDYDEDGNYSIATISAPANATGKVAVIVNNNEENPVFESNLTSLSYEEDDEDSNIRDYFINLNQLNFEFAKDGTEYSILVKYFGGNYGDDYDDGTISFTDPTDDREIPSISIRVVDEYLIGSSEMIYVTIEEQLSENVIIILNDQEIYNGKIDDWEYDFNLDEHTKSFNLAEYGLKLGENTIKVSYAGDDYYLPYNRTETIDAVFMIVENDGDDSVFEISLADDATGTVEIFINGTSFLNITAEQLKDKSYYELDLPFGNYTYEVKYKDDEKYSLDQPFDGEFEVSYYFDVGFEDYYDGEYDYEVDIGKNLTFGINIARDAKGPVIVSYNGKNISVPFYESEDEDDYGEYMRYVTFSDLEIGEQTFIFSYSDDKYPLKTIEKIVYVNPIFVVPETVKYAGDDLITLVLPQNATGNLIIKKGKYNETTFETDYDELLANVTLVDGKATYSLANLSLGKYELLVYYDGEDYEEYVEEEYVSVDIVPNVNVPECIYNETENAIIVILPDDVNDNLTVTVVSGYFDDEFGEYIISYNEEIYNAVANGTVNVKLPNLTAGFYQVYLKYGEDVIYDEKGYYYFDLEVRDNEPVFDLNVTFPTTVVNDDESSQYWEVSGIPENAYGDVELYINGKLYGDYGAYNGEHYINSLDLFKFGENTWEVRFVNDKYYKETSKSGKVTLEWVNIPAVMNNNEDIRVNLDDKEGYIDLIIDGKAYKSEFLKDGEAKISLNDLAIGTHTYEISYYDNNNVKQLTKSGSFNVTFYMETNIENDDEVPNSLVDEFEFFVFVPDDATGNIQVTVDGNNYTADIINGTASFIIKDLVLGDNNFTITYSGDSKYPSSEIKEVLKIEKYAIEEKHTQEDGFVYVAIRLPSDANGSLVIYNAEEYEWEAIPVGEAILTQKLVNGVAKIEASRFPKGVIYMLAVYESEDGDYDVDSKLLEFTILPDMNISDEIVLGDNATFSIDLPGATGNVSVYELINEEKSFIEKFEIINGKVQGNISGLGLGDHEILLVYEGDNYTDLFGDNSFTITVTPKKVDIPGVFNDDGSGEIALEVAEGSSGKVSVYEVINKDDEDETLVPLIENANYTSENKTVSVSGLKPGQHNLRLVYTDNETGDTYVKDAEVEVPKVDSSKAVEIPDTVSGDVLDITMPKGASGSVLVTIDGNTTMVPIVNGSAKVNLSKVADGAHTVTVKYPGNENCTEFEKTVSVTVKRPVDPKITASNLNVLYTAGTKYSVTIYGTDGKVAPNTEVTFLINGKVFKTVKTDAKGVASVKITQKPGTYKITTKALGKEVTKTLKVKHIVKLQKVKVKRSAKKLVIKVTLSKVNGKYIKGKKVTLKFKGKTYKVKTNKKGVAKFTIKKNVLKKLKAGKKITYKATYLKDTVKRTVKVKK